MRYHEIIAEATTDYVKKLVDPALMTYGEYYRMVNANGKFHDSNSYRFSVDEYKTRGQSFERQKREDYPILLRRLKVNGVVFEFRLKKTDRWTLKFVKTDPQTGDVLRDEHGGVIYYTREEIERGDLQTRRWDYTTGIFTEEDGYIGGSQDEWGCMLVRVADEYRGFGLGPIIGKIAREFEPDKPSGGFTHAGHSNFVRVHREFVRDYVKTGMYSHLVKSGQITAGRAKAIIASAKLEQKPLQSKFSADLSSNDPKDWLLLGTGHGDFIIYDRKLKDIIDGGDQMDRWHDRMIKGMVYAYTSGDYCRIKVFGADTESLGRFLMTLALGEAQRDGVPLVVEPEDLKFVDRSRATVENDAPDNRTGYAGHTVVPTGQPVNWTGMARAEAAWRGGFDRYDEFKNRVLELAYAKYRQG